MSASVMFASTPCMLERELHIVTEPQHQILSNFIRQYEERATTIERQIVDCQTSDINQLHISLTVVEDNEQLESPPASQMLVPYWMMRLLASSMTKGGGISPQLYVPQEVWLQDGAKYTALPPKIEACETILDRIYALEVVSPEDRRTFLKEMDDFVLHMASVQNFLAYQLKFIPEAHEGGGPPKGGGGNVGDRLKKFGQSMTKTATLLGSGLYLKSTEELVFGYIEALVNLFDRSQLFEKMIAYFDNDDAVTQRLARVGEFFMDVVLAFVLKDLQVLLERYNKSNVKRFADLEMD